MCTWSKSNPGGNTLKKILPPFCLLLLIIAGCHSFVKPLQVDDPSFSKRDLHGKNILLLPLTLIDIESSSSVISLFDKSDDLDQVRALIQQDLYQAFTAGPWKTIYWAEAAAADAAPVLSVVQEKDYWRAAALDPARLTSAPQGFDFIVAPAALTITQEASDDVSMRSSDAPVRGMAAKLDYAIFDRSGAVTLAHGRFEGVVARSGAFDEAVGRDPVKLAAREAIRLFIENLRKQ